MLVKSILSSLLALVCLGLSAQKLHFDILAMNKKIGECTAELRSDSIGNKYYSLHSSMHVKFLFIEKQVQVDASLVIGKDGKFVSSMYKGTNNGETVLTKATRQGNSIKIDRNGIGVTVAETIMLSTLQFFFHEPRTAKTVFVERDGVFRNVQAHGGGRYTAPIVSQSGVYSYSDGKLNSIEISTPVGKVYFKQQPQSSGRR